MKKFVLEIEMGNDAMQTTKDIVFALGRVAARLKDVNIRAIDELKILDINGNTVGKCSMVE